METWVLVIGLYGLGPRSAGAATIPGYASLVECQAAYQYMMDRTKTEANRQGGFCVPGPKAPKP